MKESFWVIIWLNITSLSHIITIKSILNSNFVITNPYPPHSFEKTLKKCRYFCCNTKPIHFWRQNLDPFYSKFRAELNELNIIKHNLAKTKLHLKNVHPKCTLTNNTTSKKHKFKVDGKNAIILNQTHA